MRRRARKSMLPNAPFEIGREPSTGEATAHARHCPKCSTQRVVKRALKRLRRVLPLQSRAHLAALANPSSFVPVPTAIAGPAAVAHALHIPSDVEGLAGSVAHPAGVPRAPQVPDRAPTTRRWRPARSLAP